MDWINELDAWLTLLHSWLEWQTWLECLEDPACLSRWGLLKSEYLKDSDLWLIIGFLVPLLITAKIFIRQMRASHYSELDRIYMDILKMAIEKPYLRDKEKIEHFINYLQKPGKTLSDADRGIIEQAKEYDVYAYIVFNFLETIHDRCDENRDWIRFPDRDFFNLKTCSSITNQIYSLKNMFFHSPDEKLVTTWKGIIGEEYRIHHNWFFIEAERGEKGSKFCLGFLQFMLAERWDSNYWGYLKDKKSRELLDYSNSNSSKAHADFEDTKWAAHCESKAKTD